MMSKKTLSVLMLMSILLGCGKDSSNTVVTSQRQAEMEEAVFESTLNERRQSREAAEERIALARKELAAAKAANPNSDRVKILETELAQWEAEARQQRAETYRIVRERLSKQKKAGGSK